MAPGLDLWCAGFVLAVSCVSALGCSKSEPTPAKAGGEATVVAPRAAILDDPKLWGQYCDEVQLASASSPPPPPPPLLPPGNEDIEVPTPLTSPVIEPVPPRFGALVGPRRAALADALELRPGDACGNAILPLLAEHAGVESVYCLLVFAADFCGDGADAADWAMKRADTFPGPRAAAALLLRHFAALAPDPVSGLPYNDAIPRETRLALATAVVAEAERLLKLDPGARLGHRVARDALVQVELGRALVDDPKSPAELLEVILAREDAVASWRHTAALGELDGLPHCGPASAGPCVPPPPLSVEEQEADLRLKKRLLGL